MLKKFLKALVPAEEALESPVTGSFVPSRSESPSSDASDINCVGKDDDECNQKKGGGSAPQQQDPCDEKTATTVASRTAGASSAAQMIRKPGEVAFFKLLNSELKKAINFFVKAQLEIEIREERVREGIDIMRKANILMVGEKWSLMAKSLYRLYKDLLLLETYAIMTYCSFSKILKKHDKVTQHSTRKSFMKNVVNKANFTHYPKLLNMITRCERLYDEVSQSLVSEGKSGLYEDERLFINMIHRLNEQVLDTAQGEEAPDTEVRKEQRRSTPVEMSMGGQPSPTSAKSSISSNSQVSTLRSLVEENAMNKSSKDGLARVLEFHQAISVMANHEKLSPRWINSEPSSEVEQAPSTEGGKRSSVPTLSKGEVMQPSAKRARSGR